MCAVRSNNIYLLSQPYKCWINLCAFNAKVQQQLRITLTQNGGQVKTFCTMGCWIYCDVLYWLIYLHLYILAFGGRSIAAFLNIVWHLLRELNYFSVLNSVADSGCLSGRDEKNKKKDAVPAVSCDIFIGRLLLNLQSNYSHFVFFIREFRVHLKGAICQSFPPVEIILKTSWGQHIAGVTANCC